jgi:hypothetical protein
MLKTYPKHPIEISEASPARLIPSIELIRVKQFLKTVLELAEPKKEVLTSKSG